jgi:hypothetical protein
MDIKAWSITIAGVTIAFGAIGYLIWAQPFSRKPIENPQTSSSDTSKPSPTAPHKPENSAQLKKDKLGQELFQSMLGVKSPNLLRRNLRPYKLSQ